MKRFLAIALAVALGLGGCGSAGEGGGQVTSPRSAFSVLGVRPVATEAMPGWVSHRLGESARPPITAAELGGARQVLDHGRAWLIPLGDDALCLARLVAPLPSAVGGRHYPPAVDRSCATADAARAGRLVQFQYLSTTPGGSGRVRIVGIVPDGVSRVGLAIGRGARRTVDVSRNAYRYVGAAPRSLSFLRTFRGIGRRYVLRLPSAGPARP